MSVKVHPCTLKIASFDFRVGSECGVTPISTWSNCQRAAVRFDVVFVENPCQSNTKKTRDESKKCATGSQICLVVILLCVFVACMRMRRALCKLQAVMKTPEGMVYDGDFVNGVPHGKVINKTICVDVKK